MMHRRTAVQDRPRPDADEERFSRPRPAARREQVVERRGWTLSALAPGVIVGWSAVVVSVVALFMSWRDPSVHADDVPLSFLWNVDSTAHHPSLLLALVPLIVLLAVGATFPGAAPARFIAGLGLAAVVVLFAIQTGRLLDRIGGDLGATLDPGFYVAAVGAFLALVSGLLPSGWRSQRSVVRSVDAV